MSNSPNTFPIYVEVSDDCLGTAQCEMTAPDLFALDDQERSHPKRPISDVTDLERAQRAASSCPTQAIALLANE